MKRVGGAVVEYAIGVDIGGSKLYFAIVNREGAILNRIIVPTEAHLGAERVMENVLDGINRMIDCAGSAELVGIGIGSAGQIDFLTGIATFAGETLPGWTGMPIRQRVERRFGLPTLVDNDVNVIAVAEKLYGAGRNFSHFICLALGTGIGGAIVESGSLMRGKFGGAGELGHVSVDFNGPRCGCGNNGCIELYASGTGISRLAREYTETLAGSPAWKPGSYEVIQAWMDGDSDAAKVMDEVIRALGTAIVGYMHAFNPQAVIIGGGVAEAGEILFKALEREVKRRITPNMREACSLLPAYIGSDSGVVGAAAQVWLYNKP